MQNIYKSITTDIVSYEIKRSGNTLLANVHDAVVVRNQIPVKLLDKVELKVRLQNR